MNQHRPRLAPDPAELVRPSPLVLALRPEAAAESIGVSLGTFNSMVEDGLMPRPVPIPGRRLVRYDAESVRKAWEALKEAADSGDGPGKWDIR